MKKNQENLKTKSQGKCWTVQLKKQGTYKQQWFHRILCLQESNLKRTWQPLVECYGRSFIRNPWSTRENQVGWSPREDFWKKTRKFEISVGGWGLFRCWNYHLDETKGLLPVYFGKAKKESKTYLEWSICI